MKPKRIWISIAKSELHCFQTRYSDWPDRSFCFPRPERRESHRINWWISRRQKRGSGPKTSVGLSYDCCRCQSEINLFSSVGSCLFNGQNLRTKHYPDIPHITHFFSSPERNKFPNTREGRLHPHSWSKFLM